MAPCARDTQPVLTSQWASVRRWTGHRANKAGLVFKATVLAGQLAFRPLREGRVFQGSLQLGIKTLFKRFECCFLGFWEIGPVGSPVFFLLLE